MTFTKISLYLFTFCIPFISFYHTKTMETVEQSIQTNLDRLDRDILKMTRRALNQQEVVNHTKNWYTQYLIREQQTKKKCLYGIGVTMQVQM